MKKSLVFIADGWGPSYGGINSFNYDFVRAIADHSKNLDDVDVYCIVPEVPDAEVKSNPFIRFITAAKSLYERKPLVDKDLLEKLKALTESKVWIAGHDIMTGFAAVALKEKFQSLKPDGHFKSVAIHHMNYRAYKPIEKPLEGKELMAKVAAQNELFPTADFTFGVGPYLLESLGRIIGRQGSFEIIPGLQPLKNNSYVPKEDTFTGITFGRDAKIKQIRLAADCFAEAFKMSSDKKLTDRSLFIIVGADETQHKEIESEMRLRSGVTQPLYIHPYTTDRIQLFEETLMKCDCCLMLSLHEGFGLVGFEAIAAQVPVIISTDSGLYKFLTKNSKFKELYLDEYFHSLQIAGPIDKEPDPVDLTAVGKKINIIRDDRTRAKRNAVRLRDILKEKGVTWENSAIDFLDDLKVVRKSIANTQIENAFFMNVNLPDQVNKGRDTLDHIISSLKENRILSLVGQSGTGKTSLAIEVFNRAKNQEEKPTWILWINADNNTIDKSLFDVCGILGIHASPDSIKQRIEDKLGSDSYLIVYDNFFDEGNLQEMDNTCTRFLLTPKNSNQKILITSRNDGWVRLPRIEKHLQQIVLKGWTVADALRYFHVRKITVDNPDELHILGSNNHILPIALSIAEGYLRANVEAHFHQFYQRYTTDKKILINQELALSHHEGLATVVSTSYGQLPDRIKKIFNILCCFGADFIPVLEIVKHTQGNADWSVENVNVDSMTDDLAKLRLWSFVIVHDPVYSARRYSIHRFVEDCIQILQDEATLKTSVQSAIRLLLAVYKASSEKELLLTLVPYVDYVSKQFGHMHADNESQIALLIKSASALNSSGQTSQAEAFYRRAKDLAHNTKGSEADEHEINVQLAKILFLKGKKSFKESEDLAKEAFNYYDDKKKHDKMISIINEVLSKISQRKCDFVKSLDEIDQAEEIAKANKQIDLIPGIYHNRASTMWTRGAKGDYKNSKTNFLKSIKLQKAKIARFKETNPSGVPGQQVHLNASKMILGCVYGLLKDYRNQRKSHVEAIKFFRDHELRRLPYTAYYLLCYTWDKMAVEKKEDGFFRTKSFSEFALLSNIFDQRKHLGHDEKYSLILLLTTLRFLVRLDQFDAAIRTKILSTLGFDEALNKKMVKKKMTNTHKELFRKLESMKTKTRYYDVDTCSVSAFLDYAQYLFKEGDKPGSKKVLEQAKAITKDIEYPRNKEIEWLDDKLGGRK